MAAMLEEEAPLIRQVVEAVLATGSGEGTYRGADIKVWMERSRRTRVLCSRTDGLLFGGSSATRLSKSESHWPGSVELQITGALLQVRQYEMAGRPDLSPEQIEAARRQIAQMNDRKEGAIPTAPVRKWWRRRKGRTSRTQGSDEWAMLRALREPPGPPRP